MWMAAGEKYPSVLPGTKWRLLRDWTYTNFLPVKYTERPSRVVINPVLYSIAPCFKPGPEVSFPAADTWCSSVSPANWLFISSYCPRPLPFTYSAFHNSVIGRPFTPYRPELLKASLNKPEQITEEGMNYGWMARVELLSITTRSGHVFNCIIHISVTCCSCQMPLLTEHFKLAAPFGSANLGPYCKNIVNCLYPETLETSP